ncbi:BMP family ABC transporter substrate-binding protein [Streptomyces sp. NPDC048295]|uniref:BMP family ABC transporter substrate-binding protein n=1 Tax=Streptomyces sp. NPDC048295 TaxID=3154617 RepID=UPI003448C81F
MRRPRVRQALAAAASAVRGRRALWAAGGALLLAGCVLLGVRWFGGTDPANPPDTRARQYRDFDACLLTGDQGIAAGSPAAPVWAGMQQGSADTRARVTYLPVMGEQTTANAQPHMNSLMQRGCGIVLAVGPAQREAARTAAKRHPETPFVVIGGVSAERSQAEGEPGNLTRVASGEGLSGQVADEIRRAVKNAG